MPWKPIDLTGKKFGNLLVSRQAERTSKFVQWVCFCDCGKEVIVRGDHLRSGNTKSCGCTRKKKIAERNRKCLVKYKKTHGKSGSRTYAVWASMVSRCTREKDKSYKHYGGRGIALCDDWHVFSNFLRDMGEAPDDHTLERVDNDGNYETSNCKWVTSYHQSRNRRNNRIIEHNGQKKCLTDWALDSGIAPSTLHTRLSKGVEFGVAINTKPGELPRYP